MKWRRREWVTYDLLKVVEEEDRWRKRRRKMRRGSGGWDSRGETNI